jgi:hypothetical protein
MEHGGMNRNGSSPTGPLSPCGLVFTPKERNCGGVPLCDRCLCRISVPRMRQVKQEETGG